jgi:hypothetical protein
MNDLLLTELDRQNRSGLQWVSYMDSEDTWLDTIALMTFRHMFKVTISLVALSFFHSGYMFQSRRAMGDGRRTTISYLFNFILGDDQLGDEALFLFLSIPFLAEIFGCCLPWGGHRLSLLNAEKGCFRFLHNLCTRRSRGGP